MSRQCLRWTFVITLVVLAGFANTVIIADQTSPDSVTEILMFNSGGAKIRMLKSTGKSLSGQASPDSIAEVLKLKSDRSKIRTLRSWDKTLSEQDIAALEQTIKDTEYQNWLLNHCAKALIRRQVPGRYVVSEKVEKAEELLGQPRALKRTRSSFDKEIDSIAGLGNEIVPFLLDTLQYKDGYETSIVIRVLGELNDDRIVPLLKQRIERKTRNDSPREELLALLKQDPSDEMVHYVKDVIVGKKATWARNI